MTSRFLSNVLDVPRPDASLSRLRASEDRATFCPAGAANAIGGEPAGGLCPGRGGLQPARGLGGEVCDLGQQAAQRPVRGHHAAVGIIRGRGLRIREDPGGQDAAPLGLHHLHPKLHAGLARADSEVLVQGLDDGIQAQVRTDPAGLLTHGAEGPASPATP